jgi:hypothetical protein
VLLTWVAGEAASVVDRLSDGEILGNLTSLIRYLTIHTKNVFESVLLKHDIKEYRERLLS